jgi:hypothetical protein
VALLRADIGLGDGDFVAMITAGAEAARHARGVDTDAAALAQEVLMLQHLLDPAAADEALATALAASRDERLSNLIRAFTIVAHAARPDEHDLDGLVRQLRRRCSIDGYDRFILNWAIWLLGLARRDEALAQRAIADQYEYLHWNGFAETWLNSYSAALTNMIDGVPRPDQLGPSLEMARREGYSIEGDCVLALAYCELCGGRPELAAELLGSARASRFNATAHHVLHGVVVEPLIRRELDAARHAAAIERGRTRSARDVLASFGIELRAHGGGRPHADRTR